MIELPLPKDDNNVPDWVHLLPSGSFSAAGGSRTLRAEELHAIIRESMKQGKIVLDENHSTDLAAPRGKTAPAMGWITAMQVRDDGIWGRVEWTNRGKNIMADKAYRAISPVLKSDYRGQVIQIMRASLTNNPDLSLQTLHSQQIQEDALTYPLSALRTRLGLPADADEAAITAAIASALKAAKLYVLLRTGAAQLAGLDQSDQTITDEAILTKLRAGQDQVSLHAANQKALQIQIDELKTANARMAGERFVEIAGQKKAITSELKTQLITLHASNPELARTIVAGLADAPSSESVTLHGAALATPHANAPSFKTIDAALGLTSDDLKKGGLG
ncbi:phage protease [Aristophania vespae]|uniref:phage protease n=1 Tax=Aristophania vespae TaxID=2697033 RepID=UPI0023515A6D|nr:phage protease [Aristophania vespae]UMM63817.1 hypothetical protein DM15PD_07940 [Aristophania vespae]